MIFLQGIQDLQFTNYKIIVVGQKWPILVTNPHQLFIDRQLNVHNESKYFKYLKKNTDIKHLKKTH